MNGMKEIIDKGHRFKSYATFMSYRLCLGGILTNIDKYDPDQRVHSISSIDRNFIDSFDGPSLTNTGYIRLSDIIVFLRDIRAIHPEIIAEDIATHEHGDRLSFVSRWPKPKCTPRDPYSPYVAGQIEDAAKADMSATLVRIRSGIEQLGEIEARHSADQSLGEQGLLNILAGGDPSLTFANFERELKSNKLISMPVKKPDISSIDYGELTRLARFAVMDIKRTNPHKEVIPASQFAAIKKYSTEFNVVVSSIGNQYLKDIRSYARVLIDSHNTLDIACIPSDLDAADPDYHFGATAQISRRLHVLRSWANLGVPRMRYDAVHFSMEEIWEWDDARYGIFPLEPLGLTPTGFDSEALRELEFLVAKLAAIFPGRPKRGQASMMLRKVKLLETALLDGTPLQLDFTNFSLNAFREWTDPDLGVAQTHYVKTISTHPRYGGMVQWAMSLVRALRFIQFERTRTERFGQATMVDRRSVTAHMNGIMPSQDELTSYLARLGLMCDIDIGSLKLLKRDCLKNAANGWVDIAYVKHRRDRSPMAKRVRDGSLETPGGLIRVVLEVTDQAHRALSNAGHPDANCLWIAPFRGKIKECRFQHPIQHPWWRFCERHVILDDDGERLDTIIPSRFRKTVKAEKYTKSGGDIYAIADDNSKNVARDHYANLPALQEIHDDTVVRGLQRALDDVTSRVIADNSDPEFRATLLSEATGVDEEICRSAIEGDEDVWLAGCLGFTNSPFGLEGEDCPTPFTECLHCINSIFTPRKLPNLLRYKGFLTSRRQVVGEEEWKHLFAGDWHRLCVQIIPQFTADQILAAEAIVANDSDSDPIFLPAVLGW